MEEISNNNYNLAVILKDMASEMTAAEFEEYLINVANFDKRETENIVNACYKVISPFIEDGCPINIKNGKPVFDREKHTEFDGRYDNPEKKILKTYCHIKAEGFYEFKGWDEGLNNNFRIRGIIEEGEEFIVAKVQNEALREVYLPRTWEFKRILDQLDNENENVEMNVVIQPDITYELEAVVLYRGAESVVIKH